MAAILLSVVFQLFTTGATAQSEPVVWVANLKGTPLVIEAAPRLGAYTLKNISNKRVVSYTFGCVDVRGRKPTVAYKLAAQRFAINPHAVVDVGIMDAPYTDEYADCVHSRQLKAAIVHVEFENGKVWTFK